MNNLIYVLFILFIPAAYFYYHGKGKKKEQFYRNKRKTYISENPGLTDEQSDNLSSGLPWIGMNSNTLIELFGEPGRKRMLNESMTKYIWSYGKIFIYLHENIVVEWKKR